MSLFEGADQAEKRALENLIKSQYDTEGNYVDADGDTMTGELALPSLSVTSLASIVKAEVVHGAFSSLVSAARVNAARADIPSLNMTSLASIARIGGSLDVRANGAVPTLDLTVSGASGSVLKVGNLGRGYVSTNSAASLSYALRVDIGGTILYVPAYIGVA